MRWYVIAFVIFVAVSAVMDTFIKNGVLSFVAGVIIAGILYAWADAQKNRKKALDSNGDRL